MEFTGLPLEKVLPSVTINPARQAGVSDRKGSIEAGKDADLVILDKSYKVTAAFVRGNKAF
jgi:N-acetylglucosamine-6-phosphate deacetylase